MGLSTTAKNQALDAITIDRVSFHSGDPGSAGTSNTITYNGSSGSPLVAATLNAASSGERVLNADVSITGASANQSITYIGWWLNSGTVFKAGYAITSGDTSANASGAYTLKGTTTKLSIG